MSSSSDSDSSSSTVVPPSLPESSVDGFVLRLAEQQSPLEGVAYSPEYHDVQPTRGGPTRSTTWTCTFLEDRRGGRRLWRRSSPLLTESDDQTDGGHAMMKSDTLHFFQNLSQRERWCIRHECRRHECSAHVETATTIDKEAFTRGTRFTAD